MSTARPHALRLARLRRDLTRQKLDALLVTGEPDVRYLTGFTGNDSALLVTAKHAFFLTDGRYTEQAEQETRGVDILCRKRGMMELAGRTARRAGVKRLGFESRALTVAQHEELGRQAAGVELAPTADLIENQRILKDPEEVDSIREAVRVAEQAFLAIRPVIQPGRTEVELAHALNSAMIQRGADSPSFDTIVAFAERSSLPHARPTGRRLRNGDAILFDWGARVAGYCSDLTRMAFVNIISPFYVRVYGAVLEAQRRALSRARAGTPAAEVDAAARGYLKSQRLGKRFSHGLGHGIGLQIHEAPGLNDRSTAQLKAGMVFTVEPGVYVPGHGGVRIEDDVLVRRSGIQMLTSAPKLLRDMVLRTGI